jgi:hypothetical protein
MPKLKVVVPDEEPAGEVRAEELRLLEAMLFASAEPLDEKSLAERLPQDVDVHAALLRLQEDYATRGVNLVRIGGKWTFRTASDLSWLLSKETVETRKLSRAAIETLDAVSDLPGVEELKGSGLLDGRLPPGFSVPMPSDDPALREDEDPLEPGELDLGLAPPPERRGEE